MSLPGDHRFEVRSHLASGGLGHVFVGFDRTIQREVALKTLKPEYAGNSEAISRFNNESRITGCLEHPGVVPVFDSGNSESGLPYYAMRLLHGRTLKQAVVELHLDRNSPEFAQKQSALIRRLIDACEAIAYSHDQGIIHRDLKPANILLGDYGETVVIDWGLARQLGETDVVKQREANADNNTLSRPFETRVGTVLGTPEFMSPEQASGDPKLVGKPSDVFGLGAVLYSILCGKSPATSSSLEPGQRIADAKNASYASPKSKLATVPDGLNAICLRAMDVQPAERYSNPKELALDLESWLSDRPIVAKPDTLLDRSTRFVRKYRKWSAAAAATLIAVAIGSVIVASVINGQSNELAVKKQEVEQQVKVLGELAAKEAASANKFKELYKSNSDYAVFVNNFFYQLDREQLGRDAKLADVATLLEKEFRSRTDLSLKTRIYILANLAWCYEAVDEPRKFVEVMREHVQLAEEVNGDAAYATLQAKYSLTCALNQAHEAAEALRIADETLPLLKNVTENPGGGDLEQLKADLTEQRILSLFSCKRYDEQVNAAEEAYPWLTTLDINALPEDRKKLHIASKYIDGKRLSGKLDQPLEWQKKLYDAQKKISGVRSEEALGNLFRLSQAIRQKDGVKAALPYQKDLAEIASEVLGPEHIKTLIAKSNLAHALSKVGDFSEALVLLEELQKRWIDKLGENHFNTLSVGAKLARALRGVGRRDEALQLIRSVADRALNHSTLEKSNLTTMIALYQQSLMQIDHGKFDEALKTLETEIEILKSAGREEETTTKGDIRWRLQLAYLRKGEFEKALEQRKYFSGEVNLGAINESLQTAEALVDLDRPEEALPLLEKILLLEPKDDYLPPVIDLLNVRQQHAKGLLSVVVAEDDPKRSLDLLTEAVNELQKFQSRGRDLFKLHDTLVIHPLKRHSEALIKLLEANGDEDEADAVRKKLLELGT